ncbi:hypothetical protein HMPREF0645_0964 [Hallella bergensis DSM 17361]|uniref:Uncharacterized protein n=1 Tax=Hallella bergensis DSM 17361 TaxID=585502 RepID=D1PVH9_9BACT|nr:hypothetical protein HMPREF0645_0964 [Hallella bergensis DSM 17361]
MRSRKDLGQTGYIIDKEEEAAAKSVDRSGEACRPPRPASKGYRKRHDCRAKTTVMPMGNENC